MLIICTAHLVFAAAMLPISRMEVIPMIQVISTILLAVDSFVSSNN